MSKLRIIHVASSHNIGLTNQETQLALAYNKLKNINITVISGEKEQYAGCFELLRNANIPVIIIHGLDQHADLRQLIHDFRAIMSVSQPDVVSVNTNWQLIIAGLAKLGSKSKYKVVYTIHGFRHNHQLKSFLARFLIGILLLLLADRINAPSSYVVNKFWWLKWKMDSIPLGEDDLLFDSSTMPNFDTSLSFCFAGQFRKGKNQKLIIEAFNEYVSLTGNKEGKLILPGEGPLFESCKLHATKIGISNQVEFPGQLNRQEVVEAYLRCQIALVPTNTETFGHCVVEPLVLNRILLSRTVGIAKDVVIHGKNGFLFKGKNDLIKLMKSINNMSNEKLLSISKAAGEIGEHFRWSNIAKMNVERLMLPVLKKEND